MMRNREEMEMERDIDNEWAREEDDLSIWFTFLYSVVQLFLVALFVGLGAGYLVGVWGG